MDSLNDHNKINNFMFQKRECLKIKDLKVQWRSMEDNREEEFFGSRKNIRKVLEGK